MLVSEIIIIYTSLLFSLFIYWIVLNCFKTIFSEPTQIYKYLRNRSLFSVSKYV